MRAPCVTILFSGPTPSDLPQAIEALANELGVNAYQVQEPEQLTALSHLRVHERRKGKWVFQKEMTWTDLARELTDGSGESGVQHVRILCPEDSLPRYTQALHRLRVRICSERGHFPFLILPPSSAVREARVRSERPPLPEEHFQRLFDDVLRRSEGPILLEGETGAGKTETARLIHDALRPNGRFRVLNAATLGGQQGQFRESLFRGVKKGHFTDIPGHASLFEEHDRGTVLLDDFQDYPLEDQATLLDMLRPLSNSMEGYLLGETKVPWHADVQILVAINKSRDALLRAGRLRPDLHFRVRKTLPLPSLRETIQNVGPNPDAFLRNLIICMQERSIRALVKDLPEDSQQSIRRLLYLESVPGGLEQEASVSWKGGGRPLSLAPIPEEALRYSWPGNFRELENFAVDLLEETGIVGVWSPAVFTAVLNATMRASDHLCPAVATEAPAQDTGLERSPAELLVQAHIKALEEHRTLRSAASVLFIDARTLRQRLKRVTGGKWFLGTEQQRSADLRTLISHTTLEQLRDLARERLGEGEMGRAGNPSNRRGQ